MKRRIIVGVTGASGVVLGQAVLAALKNQPDIETHLIVTTSAHLTWGYESTEPFEVLTRLADFVYSNDNIAAPIASGSFVTDGIIVVPCSMKTLAGIACGYADTLLVRAADVCLKERRKVVLSPREMPLGPAHVRNMATVTEYGCVLIPPMLTLYNSPNTLQDQLDHVVGKILMQFGIQIAEFKPWAGE